MSIDRFLVVDDTEANLLFFEVLLGELGRTEIYTATDGFDALSLFKQHRIQFVIAAWEMSPMPGTVFVQKVLAERNQKYTPALIYSKRMSPEDVSLTRELGLNNILGMPFDKDAARTMIQEMIDKEENISPAERRLRKIDALLDEGMPGEALKLFDDVLARKADLKHRVKTSLGEVWVQIGKLDKAEKVLQEAIKIEPTYFPARQLLAKVYSRLGLHDQAIVQLKALSEESPLSMSSLSSLGNAYVDADRHEEAKEVFGKIKELDDDSDLVNDSLAKIAFKEGDLPLAAQLLQETKNGDELARYFNNLAISYVAGQDFDRGIETYENAIKILSDKAKLHLLKYNLGLAYRKKGQFSEAFGALSESYLMDPSFKKAYAALVRIVREMKEKDISYDLDRIRDIKDAKQEYDDRIGAERNQAS